MVAASRRGSLAAFGGSRRDATIREGVEQTLDYMDRCQAESGHLVVFDRSETVPWEQRIFRREETSDGRPVTVWGA